MEIIKEGKLPGDEEFQSTCRNCHTVFKYKRDEAELISDQREGDYLQIKCPLCQQNCTQSIKACYYDNSYARRKDFS